MSYPLRLFFAFGPAFFGFGLCRAILLFWIGPSSDFWHDTLFPLVGIIGLLMWRYEYILRQRMLDKIKAYRIASDYYEQRIKDIQSGK